MPHSDTPAHKENKFLLLQFSNQHGRNQMCPGQSMSRVRGPGCVLVVTVIYSSSTSATLVVLNLFFIQCVTSSKPHLVVLSEMPGSGAAQLSSFLQSLPPSVSIQR